MSRKLDYLTLCSIAAQKAGTSYGKYMAMQRIPPTNSGRCGGRGSATGHFQNLPSVWEGIHALECQKAHAQRAAKRRYRDRKAAADAG